MTLYHLADFHPQNLKTRDVYAIDSGKFCIPKKGEWYLSGAIPEAYQAEYDFISAYHIATLVRIEKIINYKIIEYL